MMKKKYTFLCGVIIFFSICIIVKYLNSPAYQTCFDFNYLNNDKVVNYTKTLLLNNKIPKEDINLWLECVEKYNSKNKHFRKNTSDGWTPIRLSKYNKIDFTENLNGWSDEEEHFLDLNCRISTFILIKDMVSSKCFTKKCDSDTEKEIRKIRDIFDKKFTDKDYTTYRSLFTPINLNIDKSKDINIYDETLKNLKKHWEKENLIFKNNSSSSLIQAVFIEPNNKGITATIGHVGLLIKNSDIIYFIEKKNPFFPYQISRFKNYNDLNNYILTPFKEFKNCKLMILQNDNVIFKHDV